MALVRSQWGRLLTSDNLINIFQACYRIGHYQTEKGRDTSGGCRGTGCCVLDWVLWAGCGGQGRVCRVTTGFLLGLLWSEPRAQQGSGVVLGRTSAASCAAGRCSAQAAVQGTEGAVVALWLLGCSRPTPPMAR